MSHAAAWRQAWGPAWRAGWWAGRRAGAMQPRASHVSCCTAGSAAARQGGGGTERHHRVAELLGATPLPLIPHKQIKMHKAVPAIKSKMKLSTQRQAALTVVIIALHAKLGALQRAAPNAAKQRPLPPGQVLCQDLRRSRTQNREIVCLCTQTSALSQVSQVLSFTLCTTPQEAFLSMPRPRPAHARSPQPKLRPNSWPSSPSSSHP